MPDNRNISDRVRDEQRRVFRLATDPTRYGLTLKAISIDSGLNYDSLRGYSSGATMMPVCALHALCGVIPDELLSLLLPGNRLIVEAPEDVDHDTLAGLALDYASQHARARHPESPGGVNIVPEEASELNASADRLRAVGNGG